MFNMFIALTVLFFVPLLVALVETHYLVDQRQRDEAFKKNNELMFGSAGASADGR